MIEDMPRLIAIGTPISISPITIEKRNTISMS
jgi:hypothetical protein